jgi:hypothetical protein
LRWRFSNLFGHFPFELKEAFMPPILSEEALLL